MQQTILVPVEQIKKKIPPRILNNPNITTDPDKLAEIIREKKIDESAIAYLVEGVHASGLIDELLKVKIDVFKNRQRAKINLEISSNSSLNRHDSSQTMPHLTKAELRRMRTRSKKRALDIRKRLGLPDYRDVDGFALLDGLLNEYSRPGDDAVQLLKETREN